MEHRDVGGGMSKRERAQSAPGFVVLRRVGRDRWQLLGEVARVRGLPARAARTRAILDATGGAAKAGEVYAAVLRSEWRVAMDWTPPTGGST
jgi:hypothetical protein